MPAMPQNARVREAVVPNAPECLFQVGVAVSNATGFLMQPSMCNSGVWRCDLDDWDGPVPFSDGFVGWTLKNVDIVEVRARVRRNALPAALYFDAFGVYGSLMNANHQPLTWFGSTVPNCAANNMICLRTPRDDVALGRRLQAAVDASPRLASVPLQDVRCGIVNALGPHNEGATRSDVHAVLMRRALC